MVLSEMQVYLHLYQENEISYTYMPSFYHIVCQRGCFSERKIKNIFSHLRVGVGGALYCDVAVSGQ